MTILRSQFTPGRRLPILLSDPALQDNSRTPLIEQAPARGAVDPGKIEILKKVIAAIDELPPELRDAVYHVHIESLPVNEVAEEFGISRHALRQRIDKAFEILARKFSDLNDLFHDE